MDPSHSRPNDPVAAGGWLEAATLLISLYGARPAPGGVAPAPVWDAADRSLPDGVLGGSRNGGFVEADVSRDVRCAQRLARAGWERTEVKAL